MTMLKYLRECSGLSRKEVSELCGINLRSLQDYEQGHKDITHAKGELLYKLSLALGCRVECLLEPYLLKENASGEKLTTQAVKKLSHYPEVTTIRSYTHKVHGKLTFEENTCNVVFVYKGKIVKVSFPAVINDQTLPWLAEAAIMKMDDYIEDAMFQETAVRVEGDGWDEW